MFAQQTINEGDCVDTDYINDLLENLRFLEECSQTNNQQFACKQIVAEESGSIRVAASTETCFDLQSLSGTVNPNTGSVSEQKMLFFTRQTTSSVNISDSSNGVVRPTRTARILCNGQTIKTISAQEMSGSFAAIPFQCPTNSDIQLCFDSQLMVVSGQPGLVSGTQTIKICASLICITETENSALSGFFLPPEIDAGCCMGREAIHLAIKNTSALRSAFSEFGQVPSCQTYEFPDQDDHVLENTAPTVMDFLVLGTLTVCGQNNSTTSTASLTASPVITCGNDRINCVSVELEIPKASDGPRTRCLSVPVLACGQCQPGESLTASIRSQFQCNEEASQVVEGVQAGIVSVNQEYCVFKFRRFETDFGDALNGTLGKCIDVELLQNINTSLNAINAICENPTPINLTTRDISGIGGNGETVILQQAQPWPPLNDPTNTNPIPIKKWYLIGTVRPCASGIGGLNLEDTRVVAGEATIMCGGTVIDSATSTWTLTSSGSSQRCGPTLSFRQCIECPIDQDLTISFQGNTVVGGFGTPSEFTYEMQLFCF